MSAGTTDDYIGPFKPTDSENSNAVSQLTEEELAYQQYGSNFRIQQSEDPYTGVIGSRDSNNTSDYHMTINPATEQALSGTATLKSSNSSYSYEMNSNGQVSVTYSTNSNTESTEQFLQSEHIISNSSAQDTFVHTSDNTYASISGVESDTESLYRSYSAGYSSDYVTSDSKSTSYNVFNKKTNLGLNEDSNAPSPTDILITSEEADNMLNASGLSHPSTMMQHRFRHFARYGFLDPYNEAFGTVKEYLFFTKPDLHIFDPNTAKLCDEISGVPFFQEAFKTYRHSLYCLQQTFADPLHYDASTAGSSFGSQNISITNQITNLQMLWNPILTNQCVSSLELPGSTASDIVNNQTLFANNTSYRLSSESSDAAWEFSLEFRETKYLDIYQIFKAYDQYIKEKGFLLLSPVKKEYTIKKINPELFSIWKILVDDTSRIIYWAKAIGVAPMSVPRDSMNATAIEGTLNVPISFKAQFVRDMDPINLLEINHISAVSMGTDDTTLHNYVYSDKDVLLMSQDTHGMCGANTWAGMPYIYSTSYNPKRTNDPTKATQDGDADDPIFYKLVWLKPNI